MLLQKVKKKQKKTYKIMIDNTCTRLLNYVCVQIHLNGLKYM